MSTHARGRGDRGAVLIEFAVVFPIVMLLLLALADFALAELSDAAGSNAAREGARVGILYYEGAHDGTSANHTKIASAVAAKLGGNVAGTPTVTVRCLEEDGTARAGGGSCSTVGADRVEVGEDLIEVSVRWDRRGGITGFVGNGFRTDKAIMRIVGAPPTGSAGAPTSCSITASSASPSSVVHTGGSIPAVTFEVTVSNPLFCGAPLLTFPVESGDGTAHTMLPTLAANTYAVTMPAGTGTWTAGTKSAPVRANGGATTATITFDVVDPSTCLITGASATPSTVSQTGGTLSSDVTFDVTVSDAGVCGTPTLTFPPAAGYAGAQPMNPAGANAFTFVLPANQGSWSNGDHTIVANANDGATASIGLTVTNPPQCALTNLDITPSTASVNGAGKIQTTVTITIARNSLTLCEVPTVTVTPGNSGPSGEPTDLTTPKTMHNPGTTADCTSLTCEWVIASDTWNWAPAPSQRTVTVTASGATASGTLNLT